jgi:fumarate hydratase class II
MIKAEAVVVNANLGLIEGGHSRAIRQAAQEVVEGKLDGHFPLDIFQT